MNKLIRAKDFFIAIRDDDEINGASFARVVDHLRNMEPVDAIPVAYGRWIILGQRIYGGGRCYTHYCSKCGQHGFNDYKICPNCGARMDGEN
jgi:hypothetical protein